MNCKIENDEITICEVLDTLFRKHDSKIEKVNTVRMSDASKDFIGQITFRYGRKKNEIVALSFCPFCGGNLI